VTSSPRHGKDFHVGCPHANKTTCEKVTREQFGKCSETTQEKREPKMCVRWATSMVGGRPLCDMHAEGILNAEANRLRQLAANADK
jgi:hypothetical protein